MTRREGSKRIRAGVVICGAYGMENAGDEAVLSAMVGALRRLDRDMPVTVMSRRPEKTARAFGVAAVHPLRPLRWLAAMRRSVLFLSGGGTLLQDATSRRSLWLYLLAIRMAKRLGCAVQLYGCGIGPLNAARSRRSAARTLNRCADVITVRDKASLALLKSLGVKRPRVLLAADPALSLTPYAGEREARAAFALRAWPGFWEHVPDFAAAARYAYEKYRLEPVFLCLSPEDRQAARSVCVELSGVPVTVTSSARRIRRMTLVLSMRLHGLVFALRDGTPACGVSYDPKVEAFCREACLPWLSLDGVTAEGLRRLIDEAAHLDAEDLSAAAVFFRERERVNLTAAAQLLADAAARKEPEA